MLMSTKELSLKLGISRSWINQYLRRLGQQGAFVMQFLQLSDSEFKANLRTVYYDEADIITYLNSHALFSRQTEWINLTDYMEKDKIEGNLKELNAIKALPSKEKEIEYYKFLDKILPPDIRFFVSKRDILAFSRNRGAFPWQSVKASIKNLDDLSTIDALKGNHSEELIYRNNFKYGRIRVTAHGRTWYMDSPDAPEPGDDLTILIPAR